MARNGDCYDWTAAAVARLAQYRADGLSAADIGKHLGCSRNAVIGKANREGLGLPAPNTVARRNIVRKSRQMRPASVRVAARPTFREAIEAVDLPPEIIPIEQRRTLAQLDRDTCRWPIGTPGTAEFYFCGAKPAYDRPYCLSHCKIAYQAPRARVELSDAERARRAQQARANMNVSGA